MSLWTVERETVSATLASRADMRFVLFFSFSFFRCFRLNSSSGFDDLAIFISVSFYGM